MLGSTGFDSKVNSLYNLISGVFFSYADMYFEIIGEITCIETIAVGKSIREVARLRKVYGSGRWRKRKGVAMVRLVDGTVCRAELHWYEAHGIGKKEFKIKRILDE